MAVLTDDELSELRQWVERLADEKNAAIVWDRPQIDAAMQAIEDRLEQASTKTALSNDIEAAAPGVFTNTHKNYLLALFYIQKGRRARAAL